MDLNKFTVKSQEAIQEAQTKAINFGHQEADGEHLLLALVEQSEGLLTKGLSHRLEERQAGVEITAAARKFIARSEYDPVYGARPLRRHIQKMR